MRKDEKPLIQNGTFSQKGVEARQLFKTLPVFLRIPVLLCRLSLVFLSIFVLFPMPREISLPLFQFPVAVFQ